MKHKHLFPFLTLLIFALPTANAEEEMCIQVIQPAINAEGDCQMFPTPCDVPDDWQAVLDCELIKPEDFGSNIDETLKRREQSKWENLKAKLEEKRAAGTDKNTAKSPFGRAIFIKSSDEYQKRQQQSQDNRSYFTQKNTTQQQFFKEGAFERFKELNPQLGGYKKDLTEAEKYKRDFIDQGRRRPAIMGSTEMKRTGYLQSNKVGIRKFQEPNWDNKETVDSFWERPKPEKKTRIRTQEEIQQRLSNRRIRLGGTIERNFDIPESELETE